MPSCEDYRPDRAPSEKALLVHNVICQMNAIKRKTLATFWATSIYSIPKLRGFPLLKIESEKDYDRATALAQGLMSRPSLSKNERRILDTLYVLIDEYEAKEYDFDSLKGSPLGILKQLMSGKQMDAGDLTNILGSQSAASMILTGARAISTQQAIKLAKYFKVDVGLFLTEK